MDDIKIFDPNTQLSIGSAREFNVMPLNELFFNDEEKVEGIKRLESHLNNTKYNKEELDILNHLIDELYQKIKLETKSEFIPFFSKDVNNVFDFAENKKIYYYEVDKMYINEQRMIEDINNYDFVNSNKVIDEIPFYLTVDDLLKYNSHTIELLDKTRNPNKKSIYARDVIKYEANDHVFIKELKEDKDINIVNFSSNLRYQKFKDSLEYNEIDYIVNPEEIQKDKINIYYPSYVGSFNLYNDHYNVIHEKDIYDYHAFKRQIKYKSVITETVKISDVDQLKVGDFVVHYNYGIGRYDGLKTMDLSGVKRDYLHIAYQGTDYLYVPVDQVNLILKYSSKEGFVPKLSRLGTQQWSNVKKRVKDKLTDLSDQLLNIYQQRLQVKGFAHLKEEEMHKEFSSYFPYEETPDQLQAINDVIKDMEMDKPMDRLICGDVGYGKTEVALRASFKAVYSGKQVVYLVPTTLLARQHYYVYKERFKPFGINVELMSRFVSQNKQKEVIKNLKEGKVDIVVGTHRLLSSDVKFKDLGYL